MIDAVWCYPDLKLRGFPIQEVISLQALRKRVLGARSATQFTAHKRNGDVPLK